MWRSPDRTPCVEHLVWYSVGVAACGEDLNRTAPIGPQKPHGGLVTGYVSEWEVVIDQTSVRAGDVTFVIANTGSIDHEFLIVRTDLAVGAIPLEGDRFSEENEELLVVDEIPEFMHGTVETMTVALEPGVYQVVCNIAGHYGMGMFEEFVVTA